jgi:hypothetical protein
MDGVAPITTRGVAYAKLVARPLIRRAAVSYLHIYFALRLAGALLIATLVPFLIDRRAQRSNITPR